MTPYLSPYSTTDMMTRKRRVVRWKDGKCEEEFEITPTELSRERAAEAFRIGWSMAGPGPYPYLTSGEIAWTLNYWDQMGGNSCFMDALRDIAKGLPPVRERITHEI